MGNEIVLFGGTFNPIHHGHLIVARAVAEHFRFERVSFVPAALSPHKNAAAPGSGRVEPTAADRLEMVRLAMAGEGLFDVSEVELNRRPPSYTLDTLQAVRADHGPDVPVYWIIGADMLEELPTWRGAEEVVAAADIVTAARPPFGGQVRGILAKLRRRMPSELVDRLAGGVVQTPLVDISSTDIRRRVAAGRSVRYLTPDAVVDYIASHGLYRPRPGGQ